MKLSKLELAYVHYRRTGERVDGNINHDYLVLSVGGLTPDDYDAIIKLREYVPSPSLFPLLSHSIDDLARYLLEVTGVKPPVDLSIVGEDKDSRYENKKLVLLSLYQDYYIRPPKRPILNDRQREFVEAKGVVLLDGKSGTGKTTSVVERALNIRCNNRDSNITIVVPSDKRKSDVSCLIRDVGLCERISNSLPSYGNVNVKTIDDIVPEYPNWKGKEYLGYVKDPCFFLNKVANQPDYHWQRYLSDRFYQHHIIVDDAHEIDNVGWLVLKTLMDMPLSLAIVGDLSRCKGKWFEQLWTQARCVKRITLDVPTVTHN
jgi:hypothetical protein